MSTTHVKVHGEHDEREEQQAVLKRMTQMMIVVHMICIHERADELEDLVRMHFMCMIPMT